MSDLYVWEHVHGAPSVRRTVEEVVQRITTEELAVHGYIAERHSYLLLRSWEGRHFPPFQKSVSHFQERSTTYTTNTCTPRKYFTFCPPQCFFQGVGVSPPP